MRSNSLFLTVAVLLVCCTFASAQPTSNDQRIDQLRSTVQNLAAVVDDANIPPDTREHLSELLFEKRGELHGLLRQKREALRSRLDGMSDAELSVAREAIRDLSDEMQKLKVGTHARDATDPSAGVTLTDTNRSSDSGRVDAGANAGSVGSTDTRLHSAAGDGTTRPSPSRSLQPPAQLSTNPDVANSQPTTAPPQDACDNLPSEPVAPDVEYQRQITRAACVMFRARNGRGNRSDARLNFQAYNFLMALALARAKLPKVAIPRLTAQAEDASHSKNLTANESSSGGTSLVSKAGVPAVFGFAVENGGLTRTTSGSTVTFTGNPVGLVQMMAKKGFIESFQEQDDFTKFLRKFSFGLSFDTSRGTNPGTFTGDRQQLSGYSFKFNVVDQRDPRDARHTARWSRITNQQASNLALSLNKFVDDIANARMPGITAWVTSANAALEGLTEVNAIQTTLAAQLDKLAALELTADQKALVEQVGSDFDAFVSERNDILDEIANGWIATFDYNNLRPVGTPSLSNLRFLVEKGAYKGSIDFTGNASLTFYNSRPAGFTGRTLRDFRFAGQLDVPIGDVESTGKFLISLGGRYQRLLEDEQLQGTTIVIPKGDIAAFQAKLTIPIRGTAFKIPLSFTYANRTELIQEREVRGNFGLTFDLDSIFARFNPFSKFTNR